MLSMIEQKMCPDDRKFGLEIWNGKENRQYLTALSTG